MSHEVRSYEVSDVHGLWHADFHKCSRSVLTRAGEWETPHLAAFIDDRSRLVCHAQWYLGETAEHFVHGLCQAIQKRGLPRKLMTDNGSAMTAAETLGGLGRLGIVHEPTVEYSPYQNAKIEVFWVSIKGRLMPMLEDVEDLTLAFLNEATQVFVEQDYNHGHHREIGCAPVKRALAGPDVRRPSPSTRDLRLAFGQQCVRIQRRSDGAISLQGVRFEIPNQFRHVRELTVRFTRWDRSFVHIVDPRTDRPICRIYPLDRARNATGERKAIPAPDDDHAATADESAEPTEKGVAPLLGKMLAEHAATGLPPTFIPKDQPPLKSEEEHDGVD